MSNTVFTFAHEQFFSSSKLKIYILHWAWQYAWGRRVYIMLGLSSSLYVLYVCAGRREMSLRQCPRGRTHSKTPEFSVELEGHSITFSPQTTICLQTRSRCLCWSHAHSRKTTCLVWWPFPKVIVMFLDIWWSYCCTIHLAIHRGS